METCVLSRLSALLGPVSRQRNQLRFEVVPQAGRRSRPTRNNEEKEDAMYIGGGVLAVIIIIILLIWLL